MKLIKMLFPALLTVCFALPVFAKNSLPVIIDNAKNIAKVGDKVVDLSGIDRKISFKKTNKKNPSRSANGFFVSVDTHFYTGDDHCILTADPNHYWDPEHPDGYANGNNCDFLYTMSREVDPDEMGCKIFPGTDITAEPIFGYDLSFLIPYLEFFDDIIVDYPHPIAEAYLNPIYIYDPTKGEGFAFPSLYPYNPVLGDEYLFKPGTYTYMFYAVVDGITYEDVVEYELSYKDDYNNMFPPPVEPCECEDYCAGNCNCDGGDCDCDCSGIGIKDPAAKAGLIKVAGSELRAEQDNVRYYIINMLGQKLTEVKDLQKGNPVTLDNFSRQLHFIIATDDKTKQVEKFVGKK